MTQVTFIQHDGTSEEIHVEPGVSVMQAAMNNEVNGIVAECGGACSCATCHVYVDAAWIDKLGPRSEMESDMLDCALEPAKNSRLSCQIEMTEELDGLVVRIPEFQY